MRFEDLGQVIMTIGINEACKDAEFNKEINKAFYRYLENDWGEMCDEDKALNDTALERNDRILAGYETSKGKIYIITEWDRSVTTILFANEY